MSAPPAGNASGSPLPGFYPDPSIPGYIRYWDGASWVPGTSRPEPKEGEPMPEPPGGAADGKGASGASGASAVSGAKERAGGGGTGSGSGGAPLEGRVVTGDGRPVPEQRHEPGPAAVPEGTGTPETGGGWGAASADDTGPMFFDEGGLPGSTPGPGATDGAGLPAVRASGEVAPHEPPVTGWDDPRRLHGNRPEAAGDWHTGDPGRSGVPEGQGVPEQSAYGGAASGLAWGEPDGSPAGAGGADAAPGGTANAPDPRGGWGRSDDAGAGGPQGPQGFPAAGGAELSAGPVGRPAGQEPSGGHPKDTVGLRIPRPAEGSRDAVADAAPAPDAGTGTGAAPDAEASPAPPGRRSEHTTRLRRADILRGSAAPDARQRAASASAASAASAAAAPPQDAPPAHAAPSATPAARQPYGADAPAAYGAGQAAPAHGAAPAQDAARPPWAQHVHDLAQPSAAGGGLPAQAPSGGPDAVTPWRPPVADPFAQARQQARPASPGRRLAARVIDGFFVFGAGALAAVPFAGKAGDHVQEKIDAVEQAGVTRDVWLIDGTTGGYLAVVLGVFLVFGLLYEALPTARWGQTLGKRLLGLRVLDVERQDTPAMGAAVVRWLTYNVLAVLVIGVVNVLWCVFDQPWRQCWHDKAARTFVAGK
ncbi:RDD family protein [Streptomyces phytohabitans]|uniref:RDD family protein n=1 Tax=Streptomyces phytohabitans TaxID=1150371 RepID=UPI00345BC457